MQLEIKTLANEKFKIDCELSDTVRSIKEKIASKDLKDKYEADAVKLIYSGKILEDSKTLESYSIKEDSFLVVVKQTPPKPSAAPAAATNPPSASSAATNVQQPTPTAASTSAASAAPVQPQQQQQAQSQSAQASGNAPAGGAADSFLSAEAREKALRELTDMGFDRAQSELALRASFYHVERAAEYLITDTIPSFTEGSAAGQGGESGQPSSGGSGSSAGGQRGGGADDLSELSQNPQFQALRQLIQQNPDQLQTLMQTLQATQPELYQLIAQRPQEFLELLNQADEGDDGGDDDDISQGGAGGAGGQGPPGTVTITLSPQDQQAINRLQDMGFDRNRVIEAFLACDRNEELAANYLLSSFD